ncbi:MAG: TonB-dependent receptor [Acetobacteraceae bacterium]|jgi:vitamin B12 transporter|nr:TonB-dependent receptor [Acetobacteraceae bacterium]
MKHRILVLLALAPLAPISAQTASIPETIVTATRIPTQQERLPAATTVIDRQIIEERGYVTLADALVSVPGFNIVPSGGMGQVTSGFMRGTNSNHVLVLRDGVPMNDASHPSGAFNFGNTLLGDIERIEVVRGPVSAIYGTSAIGGVINLITRRAPTDRQAQPYGELAGGTNYTARGIAGIAGTIGNTDYGVTGQSLSTRGSNAVAPRFYNNQGERDGFRSAVITARGGVNIGETAPANVLGMTRLDGLVITRENRLGQDYAPRDDPNYSGDDRNWMGFLRSVTELFGGAWATGFTLSASQDRRRYTNWPDGNDIETTDEYYRGRRERITFDNMLHLPDAGFISNSNLVFGFGTENEAARSRTNSDGAYGPYSASLDKTQQNNFAYIGTQHRFWERLDITTALRQDAPEGFDGATTWRLGGVLALPEIASRLRASGGTAYRAPALEERYGSSSSGDGPFRGNPDLRPERSTSWEAGIETDIADGLTLSALYFESKIRDLIKYKYLSPGPSTLENIDRAHIQGGEFGVNWRLSDSFSTRAAWTVQKARDEAKDTPLKRRPRNSVSLSPRIAPKVDWVDVPNARLIIAPDFIYVGRQWDTVYPNEGGYGSNGYNDEGFVFNMTASLPITQQLTAFIEARNLGNRRYEPANGFVIPGRSAILGLRGVF